MNSTIQKKTGKMLARRIAAVTLAVMTTVVSVLPSQVNAASKNSVKDYLVSENNYANTMNTVVEPYINAYKQTGYITGEKNASLYYEKFIANNAKGTVVISHGLGENLEKYEEMIYYFLNMGYSVYGMEHRGHSRSGRLGIDDTQVHVEKFDYYLEDLKTFLDEVVVPEAGNDKLYMFAHSMGGGIGTRFLEKYTQYFDAAILSAPMHEINSGKIPPFFAKMLAHGASITSLANKYVAGQGPYEDPYDFANGNTTSEARYARSWQIRQDNEAYQMGGSSYKWLSECFYATEKMTSYSEARKVKIPVLLFQAGKDTLVEDGGQNKFVRYAKNCKLVRYAYGKHELWNENDEILRDYLNKVFNFLGEN